MHTLVMKRKASLALWHWSQSLERRVLAAWLLYAMQKRRKKERYNQAMERHRKRLITTGVRQWIKVYISLSMTRTHVADKPCPQTTPSFPILHAEKRTWSGLHGDKANS